MFIKTVDVVVVIMIMIIMIMIIIIMSSFIKNENRLRYHNAPCKCVCVFACVFVLMCRRPHFKITLNDVREFHVKRHGRYTIRDYIKNISCFDLLQT
jgi:hypothetical protein